MRQAIEMAVENVRSGRGGPFAAIIVKEGRMIASGTNRVTASNDPTAHAEVVAIRRACAGLGSFQLEDCELYATCEPCPMCLGAIYWSRLTRVFYGATAADAAEAGFEDAFIYEQLALPGERRSIPLVSLLREEALACFREWLAKPDRMPY